MRKNIKWLIPLVLLILILAVYLWPIPRVPFDELYAKVDTDTVNSLQTFRQSNPLKHIEVNGITWEYIAVGQGEEAILFLHGMTGAYDIWWQQMEALQDEYRVIAVTYPPVDTLAEMETGVLAILAVEGVDKFNVVGTSLGGYFSQYLLAKHPNRILRAVFSNTFPPNDLIAEKNSTIGAALPYLPEWLVLSVMRGSFEGSIYPASGNDELTLAFLMEMGYGRMDKWQVVGRYRCVVEKFTAPAPQIPVMLIEADNDPLVEAALREQLKETYPAAVIHTLHNAGHFPYLNMADEYTQMLRAFLKTPLMR